MRHEGSCLCGGIQFGVSSPLPGIIQCHCSLCRKSSGAAGIATLSVPASQFSWICGEDLVATYERPTGYGNVFCKVCGSPAPEAHPVRQRYRIPAGLLTDSAELRVAEHIYVGSKAHWEVIAGDAPRFDEDSPS
jgi:hypothetical protein